MRSASFATGCCVATSAGQLSQLERCVVAAACQAVDLWTVEQLLTATLLRGAVLSAL